MAYGPDFHVAGVYEVRQETNTKSFWIGFQGGSQVLHFCVSGSLRSGRGKKMRRFKRGGAGGKIKIVEGIRCGAVPKAVDVDYLKAVHRWPQLWSTDPQSKGGPALRPSRDELSPGGGCEAHRKKRSHPRVTPPPV